MVVWLNTQLFFIQKHQLDEPNIKVDSELVSQIQILAVKKSNLIKINLFLNYR